MACVLLILFLIVVLVALPWAAIRSAKSSEPIRPEQYSVAYIQGMIIQVILVCLAFAVIYTSVFSISWLKRLEASSLLYFFITVLAGLLLQWVRVQLFRKKNSISDVFYVHTPGQLGLKHGLLVVAAVGEEIVYRGVLFLAVYEFIPSIVLAAIFSALAFGAAHATQGRVGFIFSALMGLILQAGYLTTDALVLTIAAHYLINLISDLVAEKRAV